MILSFLSASINSTPVLTPAMQLLSVLQLPEVARIDGDPPGIHCIITALQVRELINKSMKPMAAHRSPVGSLQVQHSLQPYQSSAYLKSDKNILTKCKNVNRKARSEMQTSQTEIRALFL